MLLREQVYAALQVFHPVEESGNRFPALEITTMLGNQHVDIHLPDHVCPQAANLVGHHVAFVKSAHGMDMLQKFGPGFHWRRDLVGIHHGSAYIAGKQDFRTTVIKLKITFGVQEVRRHGMNNSIAQTHWHALIRYASNTAFCTVQIAKMWDKPRPEPGYIQIAVCPQQPLVQRTDDVRVLV